VTGNNYNMFLITEILIIYYHYTKNVRILVQLQTSRVRQMVHSVLLTMQSIHSSIKPLGIDSHGSAVNSHSHWGGFPSPPIPIPNSVFYSHSHGIHMWFPVPLGIPFPCTSLLWVWVVQLQLQLRVGVPWTVKLQQQYAVQLRVLG